MGNNTDIDWVLILLNNPISDYLHKFDQANLSSVSKLIRLKLSLKVFKDLSINHTVLYKHSNYFQHKDNYEFRNLSSYEWYKLFYKYDFNKEVVYKSTQIDTFVDQSSDTFSQIGKHCKSLTYDSLSTACYYLIPLTFKFGNIHELTLITCEIPLIQFNLVLKKLENLKILYLKYVTLINIAEDGGLDSNINYPLNLKELTNIKVKFSITNLPNKMPLKFVNTENLGYAKYDLDLIQKSLPNLTKLNYFNGINDNCVVTFIFLNPQIEDLSLPITFLTANNNIAILSKLQNLSKLKIYSVNTNLQLSNIDYNIPRLKNLKELNLDLSNNQEYEFATKFIKLCPSSIKLNILSSSAKLIKKDKLFNVIKLDYLTDRYYKN